MKIQNDLKETQTFKILLIYGEHSIYHDPKWEIEERS